MKTSRVSDGGLADGPAVVGLGWGLEGPTTGDKALVGRSSYAAAASKGKRPITGVRCKRPGQEGLYRLARPL